MFDAKRYLLERWTRRRSIAVSFTLLARRGLTEHGGPLPAMQALLGVSSLTSAGDTQLPALFSRLAARVGGRP